MITVREMRECQSPNCQNPIEPLVPKDGKKVWRRTPRRFCSDRCRMDNWFLTQAAKVQKAQNGQGDNNGHPREHKLRDRMVKAGGAKPDGKEGVIWRSITG